MGKAFFEEANLPGKFNVEHFCRVWIALLTDGHGEVWVAENKDGAIIGAIGATFVPDMNTGEKTCLEHFWYVSKGDRAGLKGLQLFHQLVDQAKIHDCKRVILTGVYHSSNFYKVHKFFVGTLNIMPLEANYSMEL